MAKAPLAPGPVFVWYLCHMYLPPPMCVSHLRLHSLHTHTHMCLHKNPSKCVWGMVKQCDFVITLRAPQTCLWHVCLFVGENYKCSWIRFCTQSKCTMAITNRNWSDGMHPPTHLGSNTPHTIGIYSKIPMA